MATLTPQDLDDLFADDVPKPKAAKSASGTPQPATGTEQPAADSQPPVSGSGVQDAGHRTPDTEHPAQSALDVQPTEADAPFGFERFGVEKMLRATGLSDAEINETLDALRARAVPSDSAPPVELPAVESVPPIPVTPSMVEGETDVEHDAEAHIVGGVVDPPSGPADEHTETLVHGKAAVVPEPPSTGITRSPFEDAFDQEEPVTPKAPAASDVPDYSNDPRARTDLGSVVVEGPLDAEVEMRPKGEGPSITEVLREGMASRPAVVPSAEDSVDWSFDDLSNDGIEDVDADESLGAPVSSPRGGTQTIAVEDIEPADEDDTRTSPRARIPNIPSMPPLAVGDRVSETATTRVAPAPGPAPPLEPVPPSVIELVRDAITSGSIAGIAHSAVNATIVTAVSRSIRTNSFEPLIAVLNDAEGPELGGIVMGIENHPERAALLAGLSTESLAALRRNVHPEVLGAEITSILALRGGGEADQPPSPLHGAPIVSLEQEVFNYLTTNRASNISTVVDTQVYTQLTSYRNGAPLPLLMAYLDNSFNVNFERGLVRALLDDSNNPENLPLRVLRKINEEFESLFGDEQPVLKARAQRLFEERDAKYAEVPDHDDVPVRELADVIQALPEGTQVRAIPNDATRQRYSLIDPQTGEILAVAKDNSVRRLARLIGDTSGATIDSEIIREFRDAGSRPRRTPRKEVSLTPWIVGLSGVVLAAAGFGIYSSVTQPQEPVQAQAADPTPTVQLVRRNDRFIQVNSSDKVAVFYDPESETYGAKFGPYNGEAEVRINLMSRDDFIHALNASSSTRINSAVHALTMVDDTVAIRDAQVQRDAQRQAPDAGSATQNSPVDAGVNPVLAQAQADEKAGRTFAAVDEYIEAGAMDDAKRVVKQLIADNCPDGNEADMVEVAVRAKKVQLDAAACEVAPSVPKRAVKPIQAKAAPAEPRAGQTCEQSIHAGLQKLGASSGIVNGSRLCKLGTSTCVTIKAGCKQGIAR